MKKILPKSFSAALNAPSLKWMVLLFFLALLPRFLWAITEQPPPFSDMEDYYMCAVNFLRGDYLSQSPDRLAYRAPLYPLFLAVCLRITPGNHLLTIRLAQSVLGSVSAVLVYWIARRLMQPLFSHEKIKRRHLYRELAPFLIGLTYAFMAYPIFFCSVFMTETFFITLFLVWVLWGLHLDQTSSVWRLSGFSFWLGLLALTRPIALFFLPVLIWKIAACTSKKSGRWNKWIPFLAWAAPILPWTLRNFLLFHSLVLISTNSGVNFFIGNNPTFGYYESGYKEAVRREYIQTHGPNEAGEDRLFLRLGMRYILHDPRAFFVRSGWKFYFLYLLDKEPWPWEEYHQGRGLLVAGSDNWPLIRWKPFFFFIAVWGAIYAYVRRLRHGSLIAVIGLYTAACLIFFARTRFRMPLEPLLTIYMGLGILSLVDLMIWGYRKIIQSNAKTDAD
ncbi:MAG: ArnT family glycosyltransferase [Candidatus Hinthialibacter sp.]